MSSPLRTGNVDMPQDATESHSSPPSEDIQQSIEFDQDDELPLARQAHQWPIPQRPSSLPTSPPPAWLRGRRTDITPSPESEREVQPDNEDLETEFETTESEHEDAQSSHRDRAESEDMWFPSFNADLNTIQQQHNGLRWLDLAVDENDVMEQYGWEPAVEYCLSCKSQIAFNDCIFLSCGHTWCQDCLNINVRLSLINRQSFPPRCCSVDEGIDISAIQTYLNPSVLQRWLEVDEEFSTNNPMYCSGLGCGAFIPVRSYNASQWVICSRCHEQTCIECRASRSDHITPDKHPGIISAENQELAEDQGWQQCPNPRCRAIFAKTDGCDHITCTECRTDFCYECGGKLFGAADRDPGASCTCG